MRTKPTVHRAAWGQSLLLSGNGHLIVDLSLNESERALLHGLVARALDKVGNEIETLEVDSEDWERVSRQLGFMNELLGKLTRPVRASQAERAVEGMEDGMISGDIRRLIDCIQLPKKD